MNTQPIMTDLAALARHRARATGSGLFLHEAAADEIQDRLKMVNRAFTDGALISDFPGFWATRFPELRILPPDDTLDLVPAAHDLILHVMSLHWSNDPVGQIIQSRRALRPDGLFLAVAFGGRTLNELRACLAQAESEVSNGISPRVAPMADLRDMGALLQRAGLALPVADSLPLTVEYADLRALMHDLRAMGETNALTDRLRRPTARGVFDRAAELYAAHFATPSGRILATFELVFLAGWAPDDNQPKPLRPGSAQQRLADALRTDETPLRD
jgi:SAM-dependent methyltransferase